MRDHPTKAPKYKFSRKIHLKFVLAYIPLIDFSLSDPRSVCIFNNIFISLY